MQVGLAAPGTGVSGHLQTLRTQPVTADFNTYRHHNCKGELRESLDCFQPDVLVGTLGEQSS